MNNKKITVEALLSESEGTAVLEAVTFEQGLLLLEELVQKVESGSLPLMQAVQSYEKGVALVDHLRGLLSGAEEKLRVLQKNAGAAKEA